MNNREAMQKAFEATDFFQDLPLEVKMRNGKNYASVTLNGEFEIFCIGFNAALESQAQQTESQWISVEEAKATLKDGDLLYAAFATGDIVEAVYRWEQGYYPHRIVSDSYGNIRLEHCTHGNVVGGETRRVVAKFSHWNEADSFCEAANFKYSASKNGD